MRIASVLVSNLARTGLVLAALAPLAAWGGPVDINTADASTLARELNGIGPARANAIVAYRAEHGPFKSVDDLRLVKNLPQKVIDANRDLLKMEGGRASGSPARGSGSKADAAKPDARAAPKP